MVGNTQDCLSVPEIEKKLERTTATIYYKGYFAEPNNSEHPFREIPHDYFFRSSHTFTTDVTVNLRNNYVKSDYGWLYPEWSEIRKAIFSSIS